jgi:dsRNA-specific ribonuclease
LRILACNIDIDNVLLVGEGHKDKRTGDNVIEENMRADTFEALMGVVYELYGLDEAKRIVREVLIEVPWDMDAHYKIDVP